MITLPLFITGDDTETCVICSNICHPLQFNDSLTVVAVAVDIANRLSSLPHRIYSWRILVVPEAIATSAYLAMQPEVIDNSIGGFFIEMLGTVGPMVGLRIVS